MSEVFKLVEEPKLRIEVTDEILGRIERYYGAKVQIEKDDRRRLRASNDRPDFGPTPETKSRNRPDPILALRSKGRISQPEQTAAEQIRDIWCALVEEGASSDIVLRGGVVRRDSHPLDGVSPAFQRAYVASYVPWVGSVSQCSVGRKSYFQIVREFLLSTEQRRASELEFNALGAALRDYANRMG